MKKLQSIIFILSLIISFGSASTLVPGGTIGDIEPVVWDTTGHPYLIDGDIFIEDLTIMPGVEVVFLADDVMQVDGILNAHGTYADSIRFTALGQWTGIIFSPGSSEESGLSYCTISNTRDRALLIEEDILPIRNCTITDNNGHGIEIDGALVTIENSTINENNKDGIKYITGSLVTTFIRNSIIANNVDRGIFSDGITDQIYISNSIIADNGKEGVICNKGFLNIINSIVYHNNNDAISSTEIKTTVTYSNITSTPVFPGTGNINETPDFVDRINYHLNLTSPCIDRGDSSLTYSDIYFPPSIGSRRNDMGAYGGPGAGKWIEQLSIDSSYINFGQVGVSFPLTLPLVLKNTTDSIVSVSDVSFTNLDSLYFSTEDLNFSVADDDSYNVDITFSPNAERSFNSEATVTNDKGAIKLLLMGEGLVPVIALSDSQITYDIVDVLEDSLQHITIYNNGQSDLIVYKDSLNISGADSIHFSIELPIDNIIIPVADSAKIAVYFAPIDTGSQAANLRILSNDPITPIKQVDLFGASIKSVITASDSSMDFGIIEAMDDTLRQVKIYNNGSAELKISKDSLLISGSADFSVAIPLEDLAIATNDSISLSIAFAPVDSGSKEAQLNIYSNDYENSPLSINLSGTGYTEPEIVLSDTSLNFGEITLQGDSLKQFTIFNTGSADLIIYKDSLDILGNGADHFIAPSWSLDLTIAKGDSATVEIHFHPTNSGDKEAILKIVSNDPDKPVEEITLSGHGFAESVPVIYIPQTSLDFGEVVVTQDSVLELLIYNIGQADLNVYASDLEITGEDAIHFFIEEISGTQQIPFGDSLKLNIGFEPESDGVKIANLNISSNDPDNPVKEITLRGQGFEELVPVIDVSKTSLDFGEVAVTQDSVLELLIYNNGLGNLNIYANGLKITGEDSMHFFIEEISDTQQIPFGDSLKLNISFEPESDGLKTAYLNISSNDPDNSEIQIELTGIGFVIGHSPEIAVLPEQIHFDNTYVDMTSIKELSVFNDGESDLILYADQLIISGDGASFFSLEEITADITIPENDTAKIAIHFAPTNTDEETANLAIYSNDNDKTPLNIALTGKGIKIPNASIDFNDEESSDLFEMGQDATIAFDITATIPLDSVFLNYRMGGSSILSKLELSNTVDDLWKTNLAGSSLTERGLVYFVEAHHGRRTSNSDTLVITVEVPAINFPEQTRSNKYQLISVPLDMDQQTLADLLVDDLGPYDNTKYRVFDYDNEDSVYVELNNLDQKLEPGKSVWLITKKPQTIDIENGTSISAAEDFQINLNAGWNMIANPFAFPVAWGEIDPILEIQAHDGSGWSPEDVMQPYRGCILHVDNDTSILIPASEAASLPKSSSGLVNRTDWYFQIQGEGKNVHDRYNYVGVKPNASNKKDRNDHLEPPPIGKFLSISLVNEYSARKYSTDFRAPNMNGYQFNIKVESSNNSLKDIQFIPDNLPENYDWFVVSQESKVIYGKNNIAVSKNQNFSLLVGTDEYLNNITENFKLVPTKISLKQNYPNPFNPETTVAFELAHIANVNINVFDVLGKQVKTLMNQVMNPGYHTIKWNGLNDQNHKVSSGIYFLHFKTGSYTKSIKMIMNN